MSYIKDGNYYVVQSFMVNELQLKGLELQLYAIIYGFSQADQEFTGTLKYLEEWTRSTKKGVWKCLQALTARGLITKRDETINGVKFCKYSASAMVGNTVQQGGVLSAPGRSTECTSGMELSTPNNITNNINNNKTDITDQKHKYGAYENVLLTDAELDKLKTAYPNWRERIERLSEYIAAKGASYKSHYATILMWARKDAANTPPKKPDYSDPKRYEGMDMKGFREARIDEFD